MGHPELVTDRRFCHSLARWRHQDELDEIVAAWTKGYGHLDLMDRLQKAAVPAGAVLNECDLYADPHFRARDYFQELTQVDSGTYEYSGPMWKSEHFPNRLRLPPCMLGEHNDYAYRELLGVDNAAYDRLVEAGHIGTEYAPHIR
jgi:crotonobetainyl-CoA:carnitine CoA-transferase CaiB-like acyl-CoA transferase